MSDDANSHPPLRMGNFGVPFGCALIIICFFLPWVRPSDTTAFQMATDVDTAYAALSDLGLYPENPLIFTRILYLAPLLAVSTLMLEITIPPGARGRVAVQIVVLIGGAMLLVLFASVIIHHGPRLTYGFWGSFTGAVYVCVGGFFDVLRNE